MHYVDGTPAPIPDSKKKRLDEQEIISVRYEVIPPVKLFTMLIKYGLKLPFC